MSVTADAYGAAGVSPFVEGSNEYAGVGDPDAFNWIPVTESGVVGGSFVADGDAFMGNVFDNNFGTAQFDYLRLTFSVEGVIGDLDNLQIEGFFKFDYPTG